MATEIEIQNFKKFLRNEFDQTEQMENDFDELVEILNKIQPAGSVDEPEIVAFCQSKDIPIKLFEFIDLHLDPGISTFEEAFKEGMLLGLDFAFRNEEKNITKLRKIILIPVFVHLMRLLGSR